MNYQKLYDFLCENCNITPLESEMIEICNIVEEINSDNNPALYDFFDSVKRMNDLYNNKRYTESENQLAILRERLDDVRILNTNQ